MLLEGGETRRIYSYVMERFSPCFLLLTSTPPNRFVRCAEVDTDRPRRVRRYMETSGISARTANVTIPRKIVGIVIRRIFVIRQYACMKKDDLCVRSRNNSRLTTRPLATGSKQRD